MRKSKCFSQNLNYQYGLVWLKDPQCDESKYDFYLRTLLI